MLCMSRLTSYFVTHHNPRFVESHAFGYGPNDGSYPRERVRLHLTHDLCSFEVKICIIVFRLKVSRMCLKT